MNRHLWFLRKCIFVGLYGGEFVFLQKEPDGEWARTGLGHLQPLHSWQTFNIVDVLGSESIISPGSYRVCFGSLMAFEHPLSRHNRGEHPVRKEKKEASDYSFITGSRWAGSVVIPGEPSRGQDDDSHKWRCSPSRRHQLHPNTITCWSLCCWNVKASRAETEPLVWTLRFQRLCLWPRGIRRTNDSTWAFDLEKKQLRNKEFADRLPVFLRSNRKCLWCMTITPLIFKRSRAFCWRFSTHQAHECVCSIRIITRFTQMYHLMTAKASKLHLLPARTFPTQAGSHAIPIPASRNTYFINRYKKNRFIKRILIKRIR